MPAVCRLPRDKSERRPSGNAPTAWRNNYGSMASSRKNHDERGVEVKKPGESPRHLAGIPRTHHEITRNWVI
jgi:hypothetical protein